MNSYLERLRQELEEAMGGGGIPAPPHVPEGKWSPAQIFEHLLLTYQSTDRALQKPLEQGSVSVRALTLKDRIGTWLVLRREFIPRGRKAPDRVAPKGMDAAEVREQLIPALVKMAASIDECERRFGSGVRILEHPFLGPLTAGQWRKFHYVHGRHHLRQVRQRIGQG